jgi:hypothetical protein
MKEAILDISECAVVLDLIYRRRLAEDNPWIFQSVEWRILSQFPELANRNGNALVVAGGCVGCVVEGNVIEVA